MRIHFIVIVNILLLRQAMSQSPILEYYTQNIKCYFGSPSLTSIPQSRPKMPILPPLVASPRLSSPFLSRTNVPSPRKSVSLSPCPYLDPFLTGRTIVFSKPIPPPFI